jgi:hypothetical protein
MIQLRGRISMARTFMLMRGVLLLFLILPPIFCHAQDMRWQCDYDKAVNAAYLKGDLLLVNFVGKWDRSWGMVDDPRTLMEDDIWKDTAVIRLSRGYVCVRLLC